jgi:hypothetical protein
MIKYTYKCLSNIAMFDLGETINKLVDYFCNSMLAHSILSNPFITALLLVAIIVSIFLGFFYGSIKHESKLHFIRLYIYSFLIAATILLFHYRCQEKDIEKVHGLDSGAKLYAAVGGTDGKDLPITRDDYVGGNFIKVDTKSCGCSASGSLTNQTAGAGGSVELKQPPTIQPVERSSPQNVPTIPKAVVATVQPVINKTGGVATTVNVAKVPIIPSTKSPFSR